MHRSWVVATGVSLISMTLRQLFIRRLKCSRSSVASFFIMDSQLEGNLNRNESDRRQKLFMEVNFKEFEMLDNNHYWLLAFVLNHVFFFRRACLKRSERRMKLHAFGVSSGPLWLRRLACPLDKQSG